MTKKRKSSVSNKPWCWYCDREFEDEKVLITHQKAKHFKCMYCYKKLNSASGLVIHVAQIHKENITTYASAMLCSMAGHDTPEVEIFGMEGVPGEDLQRHREGLQIVPYKRIKVSEGGLLPLLAAQKASVPDAPDVPTPAYSSAALPPPPPPPPSLSLPMPMPMSKPMPMPMPMPPSSSSLPPASVPTAFSPTMVSPVASPPSGPMLARPPMPSPSMYPPCPPALVPHFAPVAASNHHSHSHSHSHPYTLPHHQPSPPMVIFPLPLSPHHPHQHQHQHYASSAPPPVSTLPLSNASLPLSESSAKADQQDSLTFPATVDATGRIIPGGVILAPDLHVSMEEKRAQLDRYRPQAKTVS